MRLTTALLLQFIAAVALFQLSTANLNASLYGEQFALNSAVRTSGEAVVPSVDFNPRNCYRRRQLCCYRHTVCGKSCNNNYCRQKATCILEKFGTCARWRTVRLCERRCWKKMCPIFECTPISLITPPEYISSFIHTKVYTPGGSPLPTAGPIPSRPHYFSISPWPSNDRTIAPSRSARASWSARPWRSASSSPYVWPSFSSSPAPLYPSETPWPSQSVVAPFSPIPTICRGGRGRRCPPPRSPPPTSTSRPEVPICSLVLCSSYGSRSVCRARARPGERLRTIRCEVLSAAVTAPRCDFACPEECIVGKDAPMDNNDKRYCNICKLRQASCRSNYKIYGPANIPDCNLDLCTRFGANQMCKAPERQGLPRTATRCSRWRLKPRCPTICPRIGCLPDRLKQRDNTGKSYCTVCQLRVASCKSSFRIYGPIYLRPTCSDTICRRNGPNFRCSTGPLAKVIFCRQYRPTPPTCTAELCRRYEPNYRCTREGTSPKSIFCRDYRPIPDPPPLCTPQLCQTNGPSFRCRFGIPLKVIRCGSYREPQPCTERNCRRNGPDYLCTDPARPSAPSKTIRCRDFRPKPAPPCTPELCERDGRSYACSFGSPSRDTTCGNYRPPTCSRQICQRNGPNFICSTAMRPGERPTPIRCRDYRPASPPCTRELCERERRLYRCSIGSPLRDTTCGEYLPPPCSEPTCRRNGPDFRCTYVARPGAPPQSIRCRDYRPTPPPCSREVCNRNEPSFRCRTGIPPRTITCREYNRPEPCTPEICDRFGPSHRCTYRGRAIPCRDYPRQRPPPKCSRQICARNGPTFRCQQGSKIITCEQYASPRPSTRPAPACSVELCRRREPFFRCQDQPRLIRCGSYRPKPTDPPTDPPLCTPRLCQIEGPSFRCRASPFPVAPLRVIRCANYRPPASERPTPSKRPPPTPQCSQALCRREVPNFRCRDDRWRIIRCRDYGPPEPTPSKISGPSEPPPCTTELCEEKGPAFRCRATLVPGLPPQTIRCRNYRPARPSESPRPSRRPPPRPPLCSEELCEKEGPEFQCRERPRPGTPLQKIRCRQYRPVRPLRSPRPSRRPPPRRPPPCTTELCEEEGPEFQCRASIRPGASPRTIRCRQFRPQRPSKSAGPSRRPPPGRPPLCTTELCEEEGPEFQCRASIRPGSPPRTIRCRQFRPQRPSKSATPSRLPPPGRPPTCTPKLCEEQGPEFQCRATSRPGAPVRTIRCRQYQPPRPGPSRRSVPSRRPPPGRPPLCTPELCEREGLAFQCRAGTPLQTIRCISFRPPRPGPSRRPEPSRRPPPGRPPTCTLELCEEEGPTFQCRSGTPLRIIRCRSYRPGRPGPSKRPDPSRRPPIGTPPLCTALLCSRNGPSFLCQASSRPGRPPTLTRCGLFRPPPRPGVSSRPRPSQRPPTREPPICTAILCSTNIAIFRCRTRSSPRDRYRTTTCGSYRPPRGGPTSRPRPAVSSRPLPSRRPRPGATKRPEPSRRRRPRPKGSTCKGNGCPPITIIRV